MNLIEESLGKMEKAEGEYEGKKIQLIRYGKLLLVTIDGVLMKTEPFFFESKAKKKFKELVEKYGLEVC